MATKNDVLNLARKIIQKESEIYGEKYIECMSKAIDKAVKKLKINNKEFIEMFIK